MFIYLYIFLKPHLPPATGDQGSWNFKSKSPFFFFCRISLTVDRVNWSCWRETPPHFFFLVLSLPRHWRPSALGLKYQFSSIKIPTSSTSQSFEGLVSCREVAWLLRCMSSRKRWGGAGSGIEPDSPMLRTGVLCTQEGGWRRKWPGLKLLHVLQEEVGRSR